MRFIAEALVALLVATATLTLAPGCAPQVKKDAAAQPGARPDAGEAPGREGLAPGARTEALAGTTRPPGHPLDDPASPLSERVIYFDLDSSQVGEQYRDILDAHARYLADHPAQRVVVEGHTDERGSREYNIGLGERRSRAVGRMLLFQGAASSQVEVVSYGEERPAAFGHDEGAWRLNRRVELVYPGH
jgi:peptidoglycan-associated lipoprotein